MMKKQTLVLATLVALLVGCSKEPEVAFEQLRTPADLAAHSEEFRQGLEQLVPGVWVAIGYGLANSVLIEGDDGLIVIDTMETMEEGRTVAELFRGLSDKPLKALIYTHNHADHVFGAQAFVDVLGQAGQAVEVLSHASTEFYVNRIVSEFRPIVTARSFRMFGTELDAEALVNNGVGLSLNIDENSSFGFIKPTQTLEDRLALTIAGVDLELVHAPGETTDQIFVWLPGKKLLAVGDNLYKAFPNLYTIRGTPYRPIKQWAATIDAMRALPVEHLAPSHSRPISGGDNIRRVLTHYRDAIQFVYDQSVRWMNQGLTPDEIVEKVQLPPHLAAEPYLQEFYGRVSWSTRAVFAGNLGWFDGNPSQLNPLSPPAQAEKMAALAGGQQALSAQLDSAIAAGEWQWALQLSDWILRLDPKSDKALQARITALTRLGEAASNPNERHYYLMSARELRDGIRLAPTTRGSDDMLRALPMEVIMAALATNLHAEKTLDMDRRIGLSFADTGEEWTLWLRRGVLETVPELMDGLEIHVRLEALIWKKMLGRQLSPAVAIAKHMEFEKGGALGFSRFMLLFKPHRDAPEPAPFASLGQ